MKNLLRFSAVMLSLGMLSAAACSSCMPQIADTSSVTNPGPKSYTCGAYTHLEGTQCVGDNVKK